MIRLRQSELDEVAQALELAASAFDGEVLSLLAPLFAAIDSSGGISSDRQAQLTASAASRASAAAAAEAVAEVTANAQQDLAHAFADISASSEALSAEMVTAENQLYGIGTIAGAAILVSLLLSVLTIARPINRVANATQRLSKGDLDAIAGLNMRYGEIGQLVRALVVFRDGLRDRDRLEEERRAAEAEDHARAEEQAFVVRELGRGLQLLSSGDLDAAITHAFPDDYRELRDNFNSAVATLSDLLRDVAEVGLTISNSVGGIATATDDLSRRTEGSAATLEETSKALAELTTSVRSTADGAKSADEIGRNARATAEGGATVMRDSAEAMQSIQDASKQIASVVGVIDDIAFQTNLLALNAGVEAARAGESGRGFAVVASEVRALAQRCSEAARQIKGLIGESEAVIETGVNASNRAGASLDEIVRAVTEMADKISGIAELASAQATTISEVSKAATQLDDVTQRNAAMFEETSAATTELSHEAASLGAKIGVFHLPDQAAAPQNGATLPAAS